MLAAQRSLHPVLSCCLCTASGNLSAQVCVPVPVYSVSRLYVVFTINFITFPHVPLTFLHVPPWLSKRFVDISYVPIRSEQPSRSFRKKCTQSIRSYTFCATLPQIRRKLYSNHTFLYVLSNPLAVLVWSHTFLQVPVTFLQVPPTKLKNVYSNHTFLHVPCNSIAKASRYQKLRAPVQQYRKKMQGG